MTSLETVLWVALPYISLTLMIGGLIWRYRSDQFGWTSRSSEIHEHVILRAASPLFHFGIIFVFFGHVLGLIVPKTWTAAVGVSDHLYHLTAVTLGGIAGLMTIVGMFGLLYRRFVTKRVRLASSTRDKVVWFFLAIPILLGGYATAAHQIFGAPGGFDYRVTISPWLRSILSFQPQPELMASVPTAFKLHVIAAFILFAVWPFTRLVHVTSAPVLYPTRPYVVYRSREGSTLDNRREGWRPVATRPTPEGQTPSQGA